MRECWDLLAGFMGIGSEKSISVAVHDKYHLNVNMIFQTKLILLAKLHTLLPSVHPHPAPTETPTHDMNEPVGDGPQPVNNPTDQDDGQEPQTQDLEEDSDDIVDSENYLDIICRIASTLETMYMS